jgi:hypothetical protein
MCEIYTTKEEVRKILGKQMPNEEFEETLIMILKKRR